MSNETPNEYYLADMHKGVGIFPPGDICAIARVDGLIGAKDKAQEMLRRANCFDELLEALDMANAYLGAEAYLSSGFDACQKKVNDALAKANAA